jgi:hypothetical protein
MKQKSLKTSPLQATREKLATIINGKAKSIKLPVNWQLFLPPPYLSSMTDTIKNTTKHGQKYSHHLCQIKNNLPFLIQIKQIGQIHWDFCS